MYRYAIVVSYDGEGFSGFQIQPNLSTIQGELERVLSTKLRQTIRIHASGRTDAGVHAIGQVAHFDTQEEITNLSGFLYGLNCILPDSIVISSIRRVDNDFHSRYDAVRKTYMYKIYLSPYQAPLHRHYYHICHYDLDIDKIIKTSKMFVGEHDFRSFTVSSNSTETTIRTIYSLNIEQSADKKELIITVCGNGFLHNMVRAIVGTLVDIGRGRLCCNSVQDIFESKDRSRAGKTISANGLYLVNVEYAKYNFMDGELLSSTVKYNK